MKYTTIPNIDIKISKLTMGAMSFGKNPEGSLAWTLDQKQTNEIVKHGLELGINFFDTANVYGAGTSEEYLGKAIKQNVSRDKVAIASKVYFNDGKLS